MGEENKSKYAVNIDIQAADGDKPQVVKLHGVAYSGCDIMQWRGPMVVDLAGMEFAPQIPLMNSHYNDPAYKLGEVKPRVEGNLLLVEGSITSQSEDAKRIVADGKLSKWQLSIGASILGQKFVDKGEKAKVNGMEFQGPITIVSKSLLREVSVVAIGADKNASMEITASLELTGLHFTNPEEQGVTMGENENKNEAAKNAAVNAGAQPADGRTPAPQPVVEPPPVQAKASDDEIKAAAEKAAQDTRNAERRRVVLVREICNGEFPDIEAKAIEEGWDENQTSKAVLDAVRAKRPNTGPNINTGVQAVGKEEMECALCLRLGVKAEDLAKTYKENTVDAALDISDISLKEVIHECIRLEGKTPRSRVGINDDDIKLSFSTVSLPGILSNVANKIMLESYRAVNPVAVRLCSEGNLNDFKVSDRYRMTDIGDLEPIAPDGEIKDGGVTEEHATNQIDTYGKKFCLTRKMIINDDLGAFAKIPKMMGSRAAKLVDKLFFARLLANPVQEDGNQLFSAAHANLIATNGTFGKNSLQKAIELFENQVDADNQPIAASPAKLLVPTALKFQARELLNSALMIATGTTDALHPAKNILADENLEIISSAYLTNAKDWYLFANPDEIDTFEIGYLKGKRTPTIQQGDTDFNTLGLWYRIFFDVGVREQDHRGMLKSIGA